MKHSRNLPMVVHAPKWQWHVSDLYLLHGTMSLHETVTDEKHAVTWNCETRTLKVNALTTDHWPLVISCLHMLQPQLLLHVLPPLNGHECLTHYSSTYSMQCSNIISASLLFFFCQYSKCILLHEAQQLGVNSSSIIFFCCCCCYSSSQYDRHFLHLRFTASHKTTSVVNCRRTKNDEYSNWNHLTSTILSSQIMSQPIRFREMKGM